MAGKARFRQARLQWTGGAPKQPGHQTTSSIGSNEAATFRTHRRFEPATPFHPWRSTMNKFIHTAVMVAVAVPCVMASNAVMQAAGISFPFPQGWASLPQLAILGSLVYTSNAFMQFAVNRLFAGPDTPGAGPAQPTT
jgi:hypothetical protein